MLKVKVNKDKKEFFTIHRCSVNVKTVVHWRTKNVHYQTEVVLITQTLFGNERFDSFENLLLEDVF